MLFCDAFDDGVPIQEKWNGYNSGGGAFIPVPDVGVGGSSAMRMRYELGLVSGGRFSIALGKLPPFYRGEGENWKHIISPDTIFRELYWREYIRLEAGWQGIPRKQSRARVLIQPAPSDAAPHRTAFQAHLWPDVNPSNAHADGVLFFNNTRGIDEEGNITDIGNNTDTSVWLPRTHSSTVIFKAHPEQGEWICVEGHIKLNDPGTSNGVEEIWIDGRLEGQRADQNHVGTYTEYGLNQVVFDNYWNRGAPGENVLYRDNIVVSTERIGCLARRPSNSPAAARPVSPTLLP